MRASKSDPVCYTSQKKCECERKKQAKKIPNAERNPRCEGIVQQEMEQKYYGLLKEYRRVQEQEATLRNNMALLRAELILCQTQTYHRGREDLRRITLEPLEIRRIDSKWSRNHLQSNSVKRPYIVQKYVSELGGGTLKRVPRQYSRLRYTFPAIQKHQNLVNEKAVKKGKPKKPELDDNKSSGQRSESSGDKCPCSHCVDFPPFVVQPPRVLIARTPTPVYSTNYRLQKKTLPEIQVKEK